MGIAASLLALSAIMLFTSITLAEPAFGMKTILSSKVLEQRSGKIMAFPSFTIDMCFKSFLLQAFEKLPITRHTFGYVIEANGMFREYDEFQLADNGENHIIWSRLCTSRGDATQDAARSAILFLKERFKFEVRDINWAEMHHYQWCYEELDRDHDRLLEENREMKTKITEYEDILGIIDGVDREPFSGQNF